jgi:hypothetical protein
MVYFVRNLSDDVTLSVRGDMITLEGAGLLISTETRACAAALLN